MVSPFRKVADTFATLFLIYHQGLYNLYKLASRAATFFGSKRSQQRFEVCIGYIQSDMFPALEALLARKYYNKDLQKAARDFTEEAIADVIAEIKSLVKVNDDVKTKIVDKLSTMNLLVAFPAEVLNQTEISNLYGELEFDGSESFVNMRLRTDEFFDKFDNAISSHPLKYIFKILINANPVYNLKENSLCKYV